MLDTAAALRIVVETKMHIADCNAAIFDVNTHEIKKFHQTRLWKSKVSEFLSLLCKVRVPEREKN